jgi:hypothetical protein
LVKLINLNFVIDKNIDSYMLSFKEYVARCDEASYNPLHGIGSGGETMNIAKTLAAWPVGLGSSAVGAAAGAGVVPGIYRAKTSGNPYISQDNLSITKGLAIPAFRKHINRLLEIIKLESIPRIRKLMIDEISEILDKVKRQLDIGGSSVLGVGRSKTAVGWQSYKVGQKPSMVGRMFALPSALIGGIRQAVINAIDSINPSYDIKSEIANEVQGLVYALEAVSKLPNGKDLLDSYFNIAQQGLRAGHIDPDVVKPKKGIMDKAVDIVLGS